MRATNDIGEEEILEMISIKFIYSVIRQKCEKSVERSDSNTEQNVN